MVVIRSPILIRTLLLSIPAESELGDVVLGSVSK